MIKVEDVAMVYSGKQGCMCGCKGKYSVMPGSESLCDASRGYSVDKPASKRSVSFVVGKLNEFPGAVEWDENGEWAALEHDERNYVVYFREYMRKQTEGLAITALLGK